MRRTSRVRGTASPPVQQDDPTLRAPEGRDGVADRLVDIVQRPANLGVAYYKRKGAFGQQAHCTQCGAPFSSQMQVDDLKQVLPHVGFDYSIPGGGNYQEICPRCRRRMVALAQSARVGGFG